MNETSAACMLPLTIHVLSALLHHFQYHRIKTRNDNSMRTMHTQKLSYRKILSLSLSHSILKDDAHQMCSFLAGI